MGSGDMQSRIFWDDYKNVVVNNEASNFEGLHSELKINANNIIN